MFSGEFKRRSFSTQKVRKWVQLSCAPKKKAREEKLVANNECWSPKYDAHLKNCYTKNGSKCVVYTSKICRLARFTPILRCCRRSYKSEVRSSQQLHLECGFDTHRFEHIAVCSSKQERTTDARYRLGRCDGQMSCKDVCHSLTSSQPTAELIICLDLGLS